MYNIGPYMIYVAQGTYSPGNFAEDTFAVPEGSLVYGGFMPGGSDISLRNPDKYETVLTGYTYISNEPNDVSYNYEFNDTVVTMLNQYVSDPNFPVDETTVLDGFTITDAVEYGIYGTDVDFNVVNCTIADSGEYGIYAENADITIENCTVTDSGLFDGIYAENGNVVIKWCNVNNNNRHGIYHTGEGSTIILENCQIVNNKRYGAFCQYSTPSIKNSVVFGNGYYQEGFHGINILLPTTTPVLYNNTIICNKKTGIYWIDDEHGGGDPNLLDYPDIQNCILWYNNDSEAQVGGFDEDDFAFYCCIQGCDNQVNNNINDLPGFAIPIDPENLLNLNPYNYHLAYDSVCRDSGNPNHTTDDVGSYDIDGEDRIVGSGVDRGADEVYSCDEPLSENDIYNPLDWNFDGMVNYHEFAVFADVWLAYDPNEVVPPETDPEKHAIWAKAKPFNFADTGDSQYVIDLDDLTIDDPAALINDWAWIACWKQSQMSRFDDMMMAMRMSGGGESMPVLSEAEGMMAPLSVSFASLAYEPEPEPVPAERSTAELVSFVEGIYDVIEYIETAIEEDHENSENLYEMKDFLEGVLLDLQAERQNIN